mmetsp:Transcript_34143/g.50692  ORF Transcript_34143/g.50692 Transcript_34143/m.50692 type:complete len:85 (-) Transcript_34143:92-346(-)
MPINGSPNMLLFHYLIHAQISDSHQLPATSGSLTVSTVKFTIVTSSSSLTVKRISHKHNLIHRCKTSTHVLRTTASRHFWSNRH